jgi:CMP-N,N'-diacetyllegionaminic acid synthase
VRLAKACSWIDKVMISTDTEELREAAVRAGADAPFLRPKELATDLAKQEDAILHLMDWCEKQGESYDYICLLCPTTPLGQPETLTKAFEYLKSRSDAEAVFSVLEADFSPQRCSTLRPDGFMKDWMDPKIRWANRQELPKFYRLSGLVTITKWEAFRREKTFMHDKTLYFIVDPVEALDINTPFDFITAEHMAERGFHNSQQLYNALAQEVAR